MRGPMHGSPRMGGNPMNPMNRMPMPNPNNNLSRSSQPLLRAPGPPSDRGGSSEWDHNVHSNVMQSGSQNPMGKLTNFSFFTFLFIILKFLFDLQIYTDQHHMLIQHSLEGQANKILIIDHLVHKHHIHKIQMMATIEMQH